MVVQIQESKKLIHLFLMVLVKDESGHLVHETWKSTE